MAKERSNNAEQAPTIASVNSWVLVQGAGNPVVNGYYKPNGTWNGCDKFIRSGVAWGNGDLYDFHIYLVTMIPSKRKRWYISICPDPDLFGTDSDIDFYMTNSDQIVDEWKPAKNAMAENCQLPPPRVSLVDFRLVKFEQIQEMSKHIDKLAMAPVWEARLRRAIGQYSYSDSLDASRMDDELEDYMFTECVVQLELVMWKKATITESAPASFRDYLDFKLWDAQGWKAQKAGSRRSRLIHVTVKHVLSYLEQPWVARRRDGNTAGTISEVNSEAGVDDENVMDEE